jgi:hypothetical protein
VSGRLQGVVLFLPVPVVLLLFTQTPLGVGASLALGVALMATHRFYARPFALSRADERCLWCGGSAAGPELLIREPFGETRWRACGSAHADLVRRTLGYATRHAALLKIGILGTLLAFLPCQLLAGLTRLGPLTKADVVALFRTGIAASVLPLGWLGPRAVSDESRALAPPFPVHIQALIGTAAVVWLFRIVGLAWLALGLLHVAERVH